MNKPYKKAGLFGLLLIPFAIVLMLVGPPQDKTPEGYSSGIVALEFASNEKEANRVLEDLTNAEVKKLDMVNYIDFPFMIIYGTFLFLFLSKMAGISGQIFYKYARWIAPIIVICDLCENLQMFRLTKDFLTDSKYADNTFQLLETFTYCKWLLLALAYAIIAVGIIRTKPRHPIVSMLFLIPMFLGVAAFCTHRPAIEDVFTGSVFLSFFVLLVYCFVFRQKQKMIA